MQRTWRCWRLPVVGYGAVAALWLSLWQLPFLQGDDRFFATASGLPFGRQTWGGITDTVVNTWGHYNGRLADGVGPVYFAFGDQASRVFMTLMYLAFTAALWAWVHKASELSATPLAKLVPASTKDEAPWSALIPWALTALVPLLLVGSFLPVAGQSVFLMAAVWNYIFPLAIGLAAFYPALAATVTILGGNGTSSDTPPRRANPATEAITTSLLLLLMVFAMNLHEMVSLALIALVLACLVATYLPGLGAATGNTPRIRAARWRLHVYALTALVGMILKLLAPGLWRRHGALGRYEDYSFGRIQGLVVRAGAAVTDVGSDYLALILLVAGAVATVYWLHREVRLSRKMTMVLVTIWLASTCIWAVVSFHRRALRLAAPAGTRPLDPAYLMQSALIAQGAALVSLLLLAWAIWRLPLRIGGIMPHVSSVAATLTFAAAAALSTSHIGGINRALYVFVIFAAVTVVALIVGVWKARAVAEAAAFAAGRARGDTDTGGPGRFVSNFAVVVLVAVAGIGTVRAGVGLYVNRAAWNTVETQVEQYRAGQVEAVLIPTSMPCDKLTWYYWPNDEAIGIFLGRYYGLPEAGVFAPVPNIASCPLLSR